jgi:hypothetical protein
MSTVLEECIAEKQRSVVHFLRTKGLNVKDIYTEMFPVYGGKCLSRKAVHNWSAKKNRLGGRRFADVVEVETEVRL